VLKEDDRITKIKEEHHLHPGDESLDDLQGQKGLF